LHRIAARVPCFPDAIQTFIKVVTQIDDGKMSSEQIGVLINESRARDTLSLWNLIPATDDVETRVRLIKRIKQFAELPAEIDQRDLLNADRNAPERWRDVLSELW